MKKALITGITGQDGAYLAALLLEKGYEVHGLVRRVSVDTTQRLESLCPAHADLEKRLHLHCGDLSDTSGIFRVVQEIQPHEIYNLAAQSHVKDSFAVPEYTGDVGGLGALRILEAVRNLGFQNHTRFYQASTSELFGKIHESPQTEKTPFYPRSPYGVAKLYAYWITINYREAYGIFACNGILFNHESPLRGETFVTRKITMGLARIKMGLQDCLHMGNLDAGRDWGHARDYVRMQWLMLQQQEPDDYVIATGRQHTVRQFLEIAASELGMVMVWQGEGVDEVGVDEKTGRTIVRIDPRFFRPTEVESLLGDASRAREKLGWTPEISFEDLVREMVAHDLRACQKDDLCRRQGF